MGVLTEVTRSLGFVLVAGRCLASQDVEADWRNRAVLGLEIVYEYEAVDEGYSLDGGGTRYEFGGTIRDVVFDREEDGFLGVRIQTSGQGDPAATWVDSRFFRVGLDGRVDDAVPLEAPRFF